MGGAGRAIRREDRRRFYLSDLEAALYERLDVGTPLRSGGDTEHQCRVARKVDHSHSAARAHFENA